MSKYNFSDSSIINSAIGSGNSVNFAPGGIASSGGFVNNGVNYGVQSLGYGQIGHISGRNIANIQGEQVENCTHVKIIATDSNGNALKSFQLPTTSPINIEIHDSELECIDLKSGDVTMHNVLGDVKEIKLASGRLQVDKCHDVGSVSVQAGSVNMHCRGSVGSAKSMVGQVNITKETVVEERKSKKRAVDVDSKDSKSKRSKTKK